jgi:hypothetical protein
VATSAVALSATATLPHPTALCPIARGAPKKKIVNELIIDCSRSLSLFETNSAIVRSLEKEGAANPNAKDLANQMKDELRQAQRECLVAHCLGEQTVAD